ncbi:MAG: hypothetical protein Q8898_09110 [Bacillota bacterium]|nr:hypothetical protein [Bacillota bacterium]
MKYSHPHARDKRQQKDSLIFIGERPGEKELKITSKPVFFDALQLSKASVLSPTITPYQFITLGRQNSFYLNDFDIRLNLQSECISLIEADHNLTPKEALEIFSSFIIQQKNTYSFLAHIPNSKIKARENGTTYVLLESKELGK